MATNHDAVAELFAQENKRHERAMKRSNDKFMAEKTKLEKQIDQARSSVAFKTKLRSESYSKTLETHAKTFKALTDELHKVITRMDEALQIQNQADLKAKAKMLDHIEEGPYRDTIQRLCDEIVEKELEEMSNPVEATTEELED